MRLHNTVIVLLFCLFFCPVVSVLAEDHVAGWGRVNMQGAIIDTACAIVVNSREQTIDMGVLSLSDFIRDGHGHSRPFSIDLVNCITERPGKKGWKKFQVTFDGESNGKLFCVNGDASGVALQIIDTQGNVAIPGKAMPSMDIIPGDNKMGYVMRLVTNNQTLKSGYYLSSIRFKLDYF
ncbi:fimbrial protein [Citrobacter portucalensis]|uniref:fimbrial protein n=1 Tax=Citrobacter portucalensis TaxID=1639133 RepID=UPI00226B4899|nr:fimbrial protein [Citrobacter portucalensis]MCX8986044.1 type 1 fimbrial protein [Citrobacter portucalensis]